MDRHCENAIKVCAYLLKNPKVDKVYFPGIPTHKNFKVAEEQMTGFGGMMSFTLKKDDIKEAHRVLSRFKVFSLAESLGGVESLCGHPATMTHASIPKEVREKSGVVDSLIRLSVGIEDVDDLIEDLKQALK